MAEEDGRLPPAGENGRRIGYTVEELLNMRQVLGAFPCRAPLDVPAMIAVQNFRAAWGSLPSPPPPPRHFAVRGYRVPVVD